MRKRMGVRKRARQPAVVGPSRSPVAAVDRAAPIAHPLLALQVVVGNQAVQRLLREPDGLRQAPGPDVRRALAPLVPAGLPVAGPTTVRRQVGGWTGKDVKPTGANAKQKLVGKTWRMPVEGIAGVGNQRNDADEAYAWEKDPVTKKSDKSKPTNFVKEKTGESAIGRAIVLIPDTLDPKQPVEVLLHLHGFGIGYRQAKGGGPTRDEAIDLTESQLEASGRNMIAVLPQGAYHSGFGAFNADAYLAAVFAKLPTLKDAPRGRVVFTAHSGGGDTVAPILAEEVKAAEQAKKGKPGKRGPSRLPSHLGQLVLFDALHGSAHETLISWLKNQLDRDLAELTNPARAGKPDKQQEYLKTSMRFRGYHTSGKGYSDRYGAVDKALTAWFAANEAALGGKGSLAYRGLRQNYLVIPTGLAPSDHEGLMGKTRGFEESLKALDAVPPLAGAPNQPAPAATSPVPAVQPSRVVQRDDAKPVDAKPADAKPAFKKQKFKLSSDLATVVKANEKKGLVELTEAPSVYGDAILKLAGQDPKTWFSSFTTITFLGRTLNQPIHTALAEHLTAVEATFAEKYGGSAKDPKTAGDTLGLSDETIKGARESPTSAGLSMHLFGLAVDLNYTANPFISANANPVFQRAGQLVNGAAAAFKNDMSYDELEALDATLETYFSYIDDAQALEDRLRAATVAPWKGKGMTPAKAARTIQDDLNLVAKSWQRSDRDQKATIKAGGFMDLKKELVEGMDLDWGAKYGDMMHFDLRNKGVGAKVHQAIEKYKAEKKRESEKKFAEQKAAKEKAAQEKAAGT